MEGKYVKGRVLFIILALNGLDFSERDFVHRLNLKGGPKSKSEAAQLDDVKKRAAAFRKERKEKLLQYMNESKGVGGEIELF